MHVVIRQKDPNFTEFAFPWNLNMELFQGKNNFYKDNSSEMFSWLVLHNAIIDLNPFRDGKTLHGILLTRVKSVQYENIERGSF